MAGALQLLMDEEGAHEDDRTKLWSAGFRSTKLWANAALSIDELAKTLDDLVPKDVGEPPVRVAALRSVWTEANKIVKRENIVEKASTVQPAAAPKVPDAASISLRHHKILMERYEAKHGRKPNAGKMPSIALVNRLIREKSDRTLSVVACRGISTRAESVEKSVTKDLSGVKRKWRLDESGELCQDAEKEQATSLSPYALASKLEILATAYDLVGPADKSVWEKHIENILSIGKRFKNRAQELLIAEFLIRANISNLYTANGGDLKEVVTDVYKEGAATSILQKK